VSNVNTGIERNLFWKRVEIFRTRKNKNKFELRGQYGLPFKINKNMVSGGVVFNRRRLIDSSMYGSY
jgi:hypothetical protein